MKHAHGPTHSLVLAGVMVSFSLAGCSVNKMAVNAAANALSDGGTSVFLTDDDPLLVAEALPFSLKLMESLLQQTPKHEGLLIATASGFVQYAHAFVLRPAIRDEATDYEKARQGRARAKKLFVRAHGYALRALGTRHSEVAAGLRMELARTASEFEIEDIPAMYWVAASLGSAISVGKSDMSLVADLPIVHELVDRAMELDEGWNAGSLHELSIALASSNDATSAEQIEFHFQRAMELNGGRSIGPLVAKAESVCVQTQDLECFRGLLNQAVAFDVRAYPELVLSNTLTQEHAAWLLTQEGELFFSTMANVH